MKKMNIADGLLFISIIGMCLYILGSSKMNIIDGLLFISITGMCLYILRFSKETKEGIKGLFGSNKFVVKIKDQLQSTKKEKVVVDMKKDSADLNLKKEKRKKNMKAPAKKQWKNLKKIRSNHIKNKD